MHPYGMLICMLYGCTVLRPIELRPKKTDIRGIYHVYIRPALMDPKGGQNDKRI
jgi:hypothetical protein